MAAKKKKTTKDWKQNKIKRVGEIECYREREWEREKIIIKTKEKESQLKTSYNKFLFTCMLLHVSFCYLYYFSNECLYGQNECV